MNVDSGHTASTLRAATFRAAAIICLILAAYGARAQTTQNAQNADEPTATRLSADAAPAAAQASPAPPPRTSATPSPESRFVKNVLRDQRAIWTSPFHLNRADSRWLLPVGLSAVALFATDRHTAGAIDDDDHLSVSHTVSDVGSLYTTGALAATFYVVGRASHNARARETGLLGAEALIDGGIVSVALKAVSQRPRPRFDDASGEFFDRGNSFPSGHAVSAWSFASIVAEEYHQRRLVRFAAYGLAATVSVARYTGRNHFLSDALVGSAIGYGIGHYVYRTHHDPSIDSGGADAALRERSKLFPQLSTEYDRGARDYGLTLAWNF
ncbi:MAG: phosphatase PAP2 family protein [Pyrinomonadaceae bacterium]